MEYACRVCGHEWNLNLDILGIARCPNVSCRSYDVWPKQLPAWVSEAMQLPGGINDKPSASYLLHAH